MFEKLSSNHCVTVPCNVPTPAVDELPAPGVFALPPAPPELATDVALVGPIDDEILVTEGEAAQTLARRLRLQKPEQIDWLRLESMRARVWDHTSSIQVT